MYRPSAMIIPALLLVCLLPATGRADTDPWQSLRRHYPGQENRPLRKTDCRRPGYPAGPDMTLAEDPWERLLCRPQKKKNSILDEEKLPSLQYGEKQSWHKWVNQAARLFSVPVAIIRAVIMVESDGDPKARAADSSAAGLMQTIRQTFNEAREALAHRKIFIENNPHNPRSSIMAGTWYLSRMYDLALADGKIAVDDRQRHSSWTAPLEYYFAGPGNGRRKEHRLLIKRAGKTCLIDKRAYAEKVLARVTTPVTTPF